jgi:hypothetical protein
MPTPPRRETYRSRSISIYISVSRRLSLPLDFLPPAAPPPQQIHPSRRLQLPRRHRANWSVADDLANWPTPPPGWPPPRLPSPSEPPAVRPARRFPRARGPASGGVSTPAAGEPQSPDGRRWSRLPQVVRESADSRRPCLTATARRLTHPPRPVCPDPRASHRDPPTLFGPGFGVQWFTAPFLAEGERFSMGVARVGRFSHTKWATRLGPLPTREGDLANLGSLTTPTPRDLSQTDAREKEGKRERGKERTTGHRHPGAAYPPHAQGRHPPRPPTGRSHSPSRGGQDRFLDLPVRFRLVDRLTPCAPPTAPTTHAANWSPGVATGARRFRARPEPSNRTRSAVRPTRSPRRPPTPSAPPTGVTIRT